MSYLVLARKMRPQTFADVIGQRSVVATLENALRRDRVPHALIFSGVRGVGKTTLARIMAKALNCVEGPTPTPCNRCPPCQEITAGAALDVQEIDGASNRGIQEIRDLKENIRYFPTQCRFRVVIIDEVHMLTTEAFNALLKTLEEPPAHVYFLFATTELHRVPVTILSRCQRHELKRVSMAELAAFFRRVADGEGVAISDRALGLVAREAGGSVRDGLSLLDQIFSFAGESVADTDVLEVLGLVDRRLIEEMARAILAADLGRCLGVLARVSQIGGDVRRFAQDLVEYFRALLVCRLAQKPAELIDLPEEELAAARDLAAGHAVEALGQHFHHLVQGVEAMGRAAQPRLVLETALIRAMQAGQLVPLDEVLDRLDRLLAAGTLPAGLGWPVEPAALLAQPAGAPGLPRPVPTGGPGQPAANAPAPAPAEPRRPPAAAEPLPVTGPAGNRSVRQGWDEFIGYVKGRKPWLAHSLRLADGVREEGGSLVVRFGQASDGAVLQDQENVRLIAGYLADFFQRELRVVIDTPAGIPESAPAAATSGPDPGAERRALAAEPLVQAAVEIFGGAITEIRTSDARKP
ncbi:MAG: DNA polymerase III subunit gamma/tau [Thermodesulfobacteriota bacterium]